MALSRSIRHPLRRFAQVDGRRRALVAEAALCLALARLGLLVLPFPTLARRLGTLTAPRNAQAQTPHRPNDATIARDVSWAVTRAASHLPFRAACLPQALAARRMLRRRGIGSVLHFGAAGDAMNDLKSHAWLDAAGVDVTGYPVAADCAEIARFA